MRGNDVVLEPAGGGQAYTVQGFSTTRSPFSSMVFGRIKAWARPGGPELVVVERGSPERFGFVVLTLRDGAVDERVLHYPARAEGRYRSLLMQFDDTCFVRLEHLSKASVVSDFAVTDTGLGETPFFGSLGEQP